MKKNQISLYAAVSIDGFTCRMNGDIDFTLNYTLDKDYGFKHFFKKIDCVLSSYRHYQELLDYTPDWQSADLPYYIISDTLFAVPKDENIHVLKTSNSNRVSSIRAYLKDLQAQYAHIWLAGDCDLITLCMDQDIIHEMTLITLPITLGSGRSLGLRNSKESKWILTDSILYENGVVQTVYTNKKDKKYLSKAIKEK